MTDYRMKYHHKINSMRDQAGSSFSHRSKKKLSQIQEGMDIGELSDPEDMENPTFQYGLQMDEDTENLFVPNQERLTEPMETPKRERSKQEVIQQEWKYLHNLCNSHCALENKLVVEKVVVKLEKKESDEPLKCKQNEKLKTWIAKWITNQNSDNNSTEDYVSINGSEIMKWTDKGGWTI